jgi:hypothetical protein
MKKISLLFLLVFIFCSCKTSYKPLEQALNNELFKNDFHVDYNVERLINTGANIISDTIVHAGNYYQMGKKRYSSNERAYYINDGLRFMTITRNKPLLVFLLPDSSLMSTAIDPMYDVSHIISLLKENTVKKDSIGFSVNEDHFIYSLPLKNIIGNLDTLSVSIDKKDNMIKSFTFKKVWYSSQYGVNQSQSDKMTLLNYHNENIEFDTIQLNIDAYLKIDTIKERIFNWPFDGFFKGN